MGDPDEHFTKKVGMKTLLAGQGGWTMGGGIVDTGNRGHSFQGILLLRE